MGSGKEQTLYALVSDVDTYSYKYIALNGV